jgi:hypothetical protein
MVYDLKINWERFEQKPHVFQSKYSLGNCLEGVVERTKHLSLDSWCPGGNRTDYLQNSSPERYRYTTLLHLLQFHQVYKIIYVHVCRIR